MRAALAADEVDVLLVSPERLNNPRFRDEQLPDLAAALRAARRRRGALHQRLGPRLPARLPADPRPADRPAPRRAGAGDDGDRQRPGRRRRRRAARASGGARGADDPRRLARDSPAPGRAPPLPPDAAARLAARPPRRPARQRHRLHPDRRGRRGRRRRAAPTPGTTWRAYTGRTDPAERERARGGAARPTRSRRWWPPRPWAWGSTSPTSGSSSTSGRRRRRSPTTSRSGRAGRATERADVLLLPGPEDRDIWRYFATASMPRAGPGRRRAGGPGGGGDGRCRPRRSRPWSTCAGPGSSCCSRCSTSTAPCRRVSGGWVRTGQRVGLRRASVTRGWPGPARGRAAAHARLRARRTAAGWRFSRATSTTRRRPPCGRCDVCAGTWFPTDGARRGSSARPRTGSPGSASRSSHGRSGRRGMSRLGVAVAGRIPADEAMSPGRALARLTDLGWGQRLREVLRGRHPRVDRALDACVRVLAEWDWARATGRRRCHAVAAASRARRLARRRSRAGRPAAPSRHRVPRAAVGRPANRAATAPSGSPGSGTGSPSARTSPPRSHGSTGRCCSSTTSSTPAGRSPSRPGCCGSAGARAVLPFALATAG